MSFTYTVSHAIQARNADSFAIESLGIPSLVLMENAARAVSQKVEALHPGLVDILCGPGNNGADGLAIARILAGQNLPGRIFIDPAKLSRDEAVQLEIVKKLGLPLFALDDFEAASKSPDFPEHQDWSQSSGSARHRRVIVDALFGSGLSRNLQQPWLGLIEKVNATKEDGKENVRVVAVDVPSGIHSDTGQAMPVAIRADDTIALDCLKWGHLLGQGRTCSGQVTVSDIGIPALAHFQDGSVPVLNEKAAAALLPVRNEYGNKGTFGKVLLCGGSFQMQGALAMAAKACFHCGCGTMTLFTPVPAARAIASKMDLAMIIPAAADDAGFFAPGAANLLEKQTGHFSLMACGNGMGKGQGALEVLSAVLQSDLPCVIDADGLNLIAQNPKLLDVMDKRSHPLILTPHVMEFSRLCHQPLDQVLEKPLELGRAFVKAHPHVILVLKSDWTLVLSQTSEAIINRPDDALAKGGSGDVLCGIITGLASMKMDPFKAAALGAFIHNRCATYAKSPCTFTPLDIIRHLPDVFAGLEAAKAECGA